MKKILSTFVISICVVALVCQAQQNKENKDLPSMLFEKGFFLETVERNLDGAIQIYESVLAIKPEDQRLVAMTYYQIAECLQKLGNQQKANEHYRKVIEMFPQEKEIVAKATQRLAVGKQNATKQEELEQKTSKTELTLSKTELSLDFGEAPIGDVIQFLRYTIKINFVMTQSYAKSTPPVSIKVDKLKLIDIIGLLMTMTDGDFAVLHGAVVIGKREEIAEFKKRKWPNVETLPEWAKTIDQKLRTLQCTMEFVDAPLSDVARKWSIEYNINFVVHPNIQKNLISIYVLQVSCLDALKLLCLSHGKMGYYYKNESIILIPLEQYQEITTQIQNTQTPVVFKVKYDVPPNPGSPDGRVMFINADGYVYLVDLSKNPFNIAPGFYKVTFQQTGYISSDTRNITIAPSSTPFVIEERLIAIRRPLSFDILDEATGELINAKQLFVDGRSISFRDVYKPGKEYHVRAEFEKYEPVEMTFFLEPGHGPWIVKINLTKKKQR